VAAGAAYCWIGPQMRAGGGNGGRGDAGKVVELHGDLVGPRRAPRPAGRQNPGQVAAGFVVAVLGGDRGAEHGEVGREVDLGRPCLAAQVHGKAGV
jgi:hypothetical protein